ncbi:hypothetical protein [Paractinoplanes brasiliensis]|uniref:DUF5666 domain-containing protein n=1 Tax=Paractinoplanes brasiliensis TaxID=52695 RepID=A0A4R6JBM5_9ACTN|nr:hypothetical protein [Actinoplanes brasiliensis]TDO33109.1 hypothetical protein C8E87_8592 [Actinoplanes brasiliensis]GID28826.1 hypothetical protein Abr02nite_38090 [Actinoplanes brasiliensis]
MKLLLPDSVTRAGRFSRVAIAVVAGGGLALGVAGLAQADPSPSASASPSAGTPRQAHLWGTVESAGGGRILIVDSQGFTRQINIATVPSDVKEGVRVHAEGTVNPDGVSLDATSVTVAPDRPEGWRGPGGHGPGGHGHGGFGPGGHGPGKYGRPWGGSTPAPSESAAPSPTS